MRALLIATAAASLVVLAGCGQEPVDAGATPPDATSPTKTEEPATDIATPEEPGGKPQDPGATPTPPVSLSPDGPVVPEGVALVPADQVDSSALPEYYEQRGQVWVYDDGLSLQMFAAASSSCGDAEAMVVDQTSSEVRIVLRSMDQQMGGPADGEACAMVMRPKPVTVTLDTPLQDRKIFLASGR